MKNEVKRPRSRSCNSLGSRCDEFVRFTGAFLGNDKTGVIYGDITFRDTEDDYYWTRKMAINLDTTKRGHLSSDIALAILKELTTKESISLILLTDPDGEDFAIITEVNSYVDPHFIHECDVVHRITLDKTQV